MWHELSQKLSKFLTPRTECSDAFRARLVLEHLEDRSMLSASIGSAPQMFAPSAIGPWAAAGVHFDSASAIISTQSDVYPNDAFHPQITAVETDSISEYYVIGPMHQPTMDGESISQIATGIPPMAGALMSGAPMQDGLGPNARIYQITKQTQTFEIWDNDGPGGRPDIGNYLSGPDEILSVTNTQVAPVADIWNFGWPTNQPQNDPTAHIIETLKLVNGGGNSNTTGTGAGGLHLYGDGLVDNDSQYVSSGTGRSGGNTNAITNGTSYGKYVPFVESLYSELASYSSFLSTELGTGGGSTVTQIYARETSTLTALSASAHDLVLQDYSVRPLSASTTTASDRSTTVTRFTDVPTDVLEGFISPSDGMKAEESVNTTDALAQERIAVDAILRELRDVDARFPASDGTVADASNGKPAEAAIDFVMEANGDEAAFGVTDGGMVALRATGDVNSSGFDLTPVYAATVAPIKAQLGLETSVGVYQAMDVAIDDAPLAEAAQPRQPLSSSKHDAIRHETMPATRIQATNNEAAVLTVTTLTGALIWMNRGRRSVEAVERDERKRRVK